LLVKQLIQVEVRHSFSNTRVLFSLFSPNSRSTNIPIQQAI